MSEYLSGPELHRFVLGPDAEPHCIGDYPGGGVYMLFAASGQLLYIGQSRDVGYRIIQHRWAARRRERLPFAEFTMVDVPEDLMRHVECAHIHALTPPENCLPAPYWSRHAELVEIIKNAWRQQ